MISRDEFVSALDKVLEARGVKDYCPNGLQVEGASEIEHVVCGVTACLELIEAAVDRKAQAILVHHGILWGGTPTITGSFGRRVKALLDGGINLVGYHLPLDRHMTMGNGATVAQRLGLSNLEPFCEHRGITVGVTAEAPSALSIEELEARVTTALDSRPIVLPYGKREIRRIGIVTGAADKDLPRAVEAGLDCYITGEISEFVMHVAKEVGIHFIAAGHHATERYGVQALGAWAADNLNVSFEFVDVVNPA